VCTSPIDSVQKSSCNATFNIFNWFRNVDGGLWPRSGSDSSSDARAVIRHRWITDEDEDLCEGRASKGIDQQEPDSIRVQEWLVRVKESAEEDAGERGCCGGDAVMENAAMAEEDWKLHWTNLWKGGGCVVACWFNFRR
jgi:hypothetical protein